MCRGAWHAVWPVAVWPALYYSTTAGRRLPFLRRGMSAGPDVPPEVDRPFPALTPAQRYHLDVYGYVVVEQALSEQETASLLGELHTLRDDLLLQAAAAGQGSEGARVSVRGAVMEVRDSDSMQQAGLQNLSQTGGLITGYACHPGLVAAAEELIGGEARLMQEDAIINRRRRGSGAQWDISMQVRRRLHGADREPHLLVPAAEGGWHRGIDVPFAAHTQNALTHFTFVKALTFLTPITCVADGGTRVIPGEPWPLNLLAT